MEAVGAEGEWISLSGVYTAEEADFMALLLSNQSSSNVAMTLQNFWPVNDHQSSSSSNYNFPNNSFSLELSNTNNNNTYRISRPNNYNNSSSSSSDQNFQPTSIDFFIADLKHATNPNSFPVQGDPSDDGWSAPKSIKRSKSSMLLEDHEKRSSAVKRPRSSENVEAVANKKQAKTSKRKPKLVLSIPDRHNGDGEGNSFGANNGPISCGSNCCSGDESINGSQELSVGDSSSLSPTEFSAPDSEGKARARRGSATDPQSLYARKRRERINERLRILQNLVPNGTKVDISTMLEEAVQYVKFLQLQIKLLSSDELWMYAPIAYNGKELGVLDHQLKLRLEKES